MPEQLSDNSTSAPINTDMDLVITVPAKKDESLSRFPKLKLSDTQFNKFSDFLIDLAKLFVASVFVGFFIPDSAGGTVNLPTFIGGIFLALFCLSYGLKITLSPKL